MKKSLPNLKSSFFCKFVLQLGQKYRVTASILIESNISNLCVKTHYLKVEFRKF